MKMNIKIKMMIMIAAVTGICMVTGCKKTPEAEEPYDEEMYIDEGYIDEYEEEYPDEYYDDEDYPQEEAEDKAQAENDTVATDTAVAAETWYTEGYDEDSNWAGSYKIELTPDGKASCIGWRNKDTGTYEISGQNKAIITF